MLAFKAVALDPLRAQFTLFPDDGVAMNTGAENAGLTVNGPHAALFMKGILMSRENWRRSMRRFLRQKFIVTSRVESLIYREDMASFSPVRRTIAKTLSRR